MKSIFLSVVIICALAISGIGGTLATWSDSEVSFDNYVSTGSLDLKVNGEDDIGPHPDNPQWGNGVPAKVELEDMIPCKWYGPFEVELWNASQYEDNANTFAHAFIHLKDIVCSNVLPKEDPDTGLTTGYPDPSTGMPWSGDLKPEPELVAEYGGKVDCTYVPGIGVTGDDCSVGSHVEMVITNSTVDPSTNNFADILIAPDGVTKMRNKLGKWECKEIWLFDLKPCQPRTIYLWFHLQQESEEDFGFNFFKTPEELGLDPGTPEWDAAYLHWQKFNDWPSWAMMKDRADFDLEFDLWLVDP